ncbi:MAG: pyruvate dehydrogenase E2 component (dihydrolipoamide acetyltransferase), partial [Chitinophagales bacterium]
MSIETIKVPDIGGAKDVDVIEVNVVVGDMVAVEQTLIVLETDKSSMEIPSPQAGKVTAVLVSEGDKIDEGAAIVELEIVGSDEVKIEQEDNIAVDEEDENAATEKIKVQGEEVQQQQIIEKEPVPDGSSKVLLPVTIPDIGGATDVDVIEVAVAVGFEVIEGDSLIVLE